MDMNTHETAAVAAAGAANQPLRPVMRYHGGKWKLAPWLLQFFPRHNTYVEPYGGAASVLMRKPRAPNEIYNELNPEIGNVFRVLRDPAAAARLRRIIELTAFSRDEYELCWQPSSDPVEQARRTVARAYMGFGSGAAFSKHATGFRSGLRKEDRSAAHDLVGWPEAVPAFVERLRGVVIEDRDALKLLRSTDTAGALFYVDPPYVLSTRGSARGVRQKYAVEMTDDDHRELASVLRGMAGMVVLSGYPCDLYDRELFADWHRHECQTLADGARERTEVVWLNQACADALQIAQGSLFDVAA